MAEEQTELTLEELELKVKEAKLEELRNAKKLIKKKAIESEDEKIFKQIRKHSVAGYEMALKQIEIKKLEKEASDLLKRANKTEKDAKDEDGKIPESAKSEAKKLREEAKKLLDEANKKAEALKKEGK